MDSTGPAYRSQGQRPRWRRGSQPRQVRGHSRLLCLVGYYRQERLLALQGVAVGPAYASDLRLGLLALAGARAQGHLLADAGPGAISLRQLGAPQGTCGAHPPQGRGRGEGPEAAFREEAVRSLPLPVAGGGGGRLGGGEGEAVGRLPAGGDAPDGPEGGLPGGRGPGALPLLLRLLLHLLRPSPLRPAPARCTP